jgi:hypothetical protein
MTNTCGSCKFWRPFSAEGEYDRSPLFGNCASPKLRYGFAVARWGDGEYLIEILLIKKQQKEKRG